MPRPVRFIHAADLHLDAPFGGVAASDERVRTALAESTYEAFDRVVGHAIERRVDFVLLAGDVYNAKDKSLRAQMRFQAGMRRLAEAGIQAFMVHGNHDPANGWSAGLEMPDNLKVLPTGRVGREPVVVDGELLCAVYGRSFSKAAETEDFCAGYRREAADPVAVGLLHTNVGGQPGYEPYAPSTIEALRSAGMDYWALGHIHKPIQLLDEPRVHYAGCPQGLNPNEDGPRGCRLVELGVGGVVADEFLETASVLWANRSLSIEGLAGVEELRSALRDIAEEVRGSGGRPAIVRVDLTGRGPLHADLARPGFIDQLLEEVRVEQLDHDAWVWVDRVRDTTARVIDLDRLREQQDFVGDLVRIVDERLAAEGEAAALVEQLTRPLLDKMNGVEPDLDPDAVVRAALDLCLDEFEEAGR